MNATVDRGEKIIKELLKQKKKAEATRKTSREDRGKKMRRATGRSTVGRKQEEETTRAAI